MGRIAVSDTKPTPGPWRIGKMSVLYTSIVSVRTGREVAAVARWEGRLRAESIANRRLVAAAPDLLEACKLALERASGARKHDCPGFDCATCAHPIAELQEAIEKAEGAVGTP